MKAFLEVLDLIIVVIRCWNILILKTKRSVCIWQLKGSCIYLLLFIFNNRLRCKKSVLFYNCFGLISSRKRLIIIILSKWLLLSIFIPCTVVATALIITWINIIVIGLFFVYCHYSYVLTILLIIFFILLVLIVAVFKK